MKKKLTQQQIEKYVSLHPELEMVYRVDGIDIHWKHNRLVYIDCSPYCPDVLVIAKFIPMFDSDKYLFSSAYRRFFNCWKEFVKKDKSDKWRYNIESNGDIVLMEIPELLSNFKNDEGGYKYPKGMWIPVKSVKTFTDKFELSKALIEKYKKIHPSPLFPGLTLEDVSHSNTDSGRHFRTTVDFDAMVELINKSKNKTMTEFKEYQMKQTSELRPVTEKDITDYKNGCRDILICDHDLTLGSPKIGDMICRSKDDHSHQWLMEESWFKDTYEQILNNKTMDKTIKTNHTDQQQYEGGYYVEVLHYRLGNLGVVVRYFHIKEIDIKKDTAIIDEVRLASDDAHYSKELSKVVQWSAYKKTVFHRLNNHVSSYPRDLFDYILQMYDRPFHDYTKKTQF